MKLRRSPVSFLPFAQIVGSVETLTPLCLSTSAVERLNLIPANSSGWTIRLASAKPLGANAGVGCGWLAPVWMPLSMPGLKSV